MKGMSEREYAGHIGRSRAAVQKAKIAGKVVLHDDGSINVAATDERRGQMTDPTRRRLSAVADDPERGATSTAQPFTESFLRARVANEIGKSQERQIRLAQLRGTLVDRSRATDLVFRLAREERDAWVTWPARVAAVLASELSMVASREAGTDITIPVGDVLKILDEHVREHLADLSAPGLDL
jgi:hypothetical protein